MKFRSSARIRSLLVAAVLGLVAVTNAWSQENTANLQFTRTVTGEYVADATLQVTLRMTKNATPVILALAVRETLPEGWTFNVVESATSNQIPSIRPAPGDSGQLQFAWINVPSFPFTMTYSIKAPSVEVESVELFGQVEYRASGRPEFSDVVTTTILGPAAPLENTAGLALTRSFVGNYESNAIVTFTANVTKSTDTAVIEVVLRETLPAGWKFKGIAPVSGSIVPDAWPAAEAEGVLEFSWNEAPEFPLAVSYNAQAPNDVLDSVEITGRMGYRTTGRPEASNVASTVIESSKVGYCGCAPSGGSTGGGGDWAVVGLAALALVAAARRHARA